MCLVYQAISRAFSTFCICDIGGTEDIHQARFDMEQAFWSSFNSLEKLRKNKAHRRDTRDTFRFCRGTRDPDIVEDSCSYHLLPSAAACCHCNGFLKAAQSAYSEAAGSQAGSVLDGHGNTGNTFSTLEIRPKMSECDSLDILRCRSRKSPFLCGRRSPTVRPDAQHPPNGLRALKSSKILS